MILGLFSTIFQPYQDNGQITVEKILPPGGGGGGGGGGGPQTWDR